MTFLLTLFDARLGWWLPNPSHDKRPSADSTPFFGRWLLVEMLGLTHDGGKFVHLSDGGHFENLGIYELVRRRCRFILSVDSSADPRCDFADLGNAVQKCRVDLGASIDIDTSALRTCGDGSARRSCAVGAITYADGSQGVLLYMKPTLVGQEPADILHYASCHPSFPHEPTSDQYFDESQFESYRRLGEVVAGRAIAPAMARANCEPGSPAHEELGIADSAVKERFLMALRHHWVAPLPRVSEHFSGHAKAMSQLFAKLRQTPELAVLDAQIYPAWTDLVTGSHDLAHENPDDAVGRRTRLPAPQDFRACFYFCQELIQMMESVYHDLDLENAAEHPDNRGWMNAFRHWSWAPMFRIAWAIGAPTFGARFIAFCEMRLGLPRLDNVDKGNHPLRVVNVSPADGESWTAACQRLLEAGRINHVEHGILVSETVREDGAAPTALYLLCVRWKHILVRTNSNIPDTTLGVAVLGGGTLRILRVQDHVRCLGLGAEFMRLLVSVVPIAAVDVRGGHYGAAGVYRKRDADRTTVYLTAMRDRTLKLMRVRNDAVRAARTARRARWQARGEAGEGDDSRAD